LEAAGIEFIDENGGGLGFDFASRPDKNGDGPNTENGSNAIECRGCKLTRMGEGRGSISEQTSA